ncbi:molybdopterin-containing oxidoreductase family protein [Candidatus Magnetominusculus xianensis]|uniref:Molybdopterin oxidoreductase n=1 Tax=Candidatus Magnetominusculus xianensis TaxID=1748249 RepID=A0ABR5SGU5_9BACT|nr:molybdopterin-dependent oxidoreductase [Candidatus Magnetominusculus xianensis]KWT90529.1 molybdopterin oxidoreductase [Candidatus Magnetominusculus xianensis]MBF0404146.1 molybdopterin-dependent oxidoreductase [Nitrospirota bacterium]
MPVVKSICRVCHGGCGALVSVEDGRVVKIKGDPQSPVSRGWMCVKGLKSPDIANHPDRLKHPLKRAGRRGENRWSEIGWTEALDEISNRIDDLRKTHGPESIAIGQGTGRHHYMHVVRFANALGTPNWYEPGLAQCFIPRITVSHLTYGGFVVGDYYGEVKPKCIIFWGHNPLVSSADGELAPAVKRAMTEGCATIAIDPRRSETAKRCKTWLAIRPATDAALALAMINVIITEGLYDKEFVATHTTGFDLLQAHTARYTPEWAEGVTWIKAEAIVNTARQYATSKPAVLDWGLGLEQNANSLQTVRAVAILRAITGNLDVPGGDILGMNILKGYPILKDKLPPDSSKKRLGGEEFKLLSSWRAYMPSAHIPALFSAMTDGVPYKIRGLLVFGGNPLLTVSNSRKVYEALNALELLCVTDLFMTPTARLADYVLPAAFWTEIDHVQGFPLVVENYAYAQTAVTQTAECRQDEWIIDELSKRLSLHGSDMSYKDIYAHQLSSTGLTHAALAQKGYHMPPHKYRKYEEHGFRTPSKKVELFSSVLKRMGYPPLPEYAEPPESPVSSPELSAEYPYVLITGARNKEFFHSEQRQVASLRRLHPEPSCELHPKAAAATGISEGDWAVVSTIRGEAKFKVHVTEDIHPQVISVEHGWWFPERDNELESLWESNANCLTADTPPYDPAFGSYRLRGLLCNIRRLNHG